MMSQDGPPSDDQPELAPPARITRGTLIGCVGLLCVLLTLPLLWLAVGVGTGWLAHVLPLLAFVAAIGGAALTLRVPASRVAGSTDPRRPLTHTGLTPTLERPARLVNQLSWSLTLALLLCAGGGYLLEVGGARSVWGLALMLGAGALLLTQGWLIAAGRVAAPGLRWVRLSIYGETTRQSATIAAAGLVIIGGALFLALLDGYPWGALGLGLLIVSLVALSPLARRAPRRPDGPRGGMPGSGAR